MSAPKPWSYTAYDDFKNCPRQFYGKRVAKKFVEEKSPQQLWGEYVHKAFEDHQNENKPLPPDLVAHQKFMDRLRNRPGNHFTEQKCGINKQLQPTHFFGSDVWWRGVIDYLKVHEVDALITDYKTGKPHNKFEQLDLFAFHTFLMFPDVESIRGEYYWTQTQDVTKKLYSRENMHDLLVPFVPTLRQYAQAFKMDIWQPRQSGLCHGWCPDKECEFWKPKRNR